MSNCAAIGVGFIPLIDVGSSPHEGVPLGLYPGGNAIPVAHLDAGLTCADVVTPRKPNGQTHPNGNIGLLSIGPSNTRREFDAFIAQGPAPNPKVVFVNGAQIGIASAEWADPLNLCWTRLDIAVANAGLTNAQVQVVWMKLFTKEPTDPSWPDATDTLQAHLETVCGLLVARFPNLKIAYLSSRVYGGYADGPGNPEPYAYDGAFAVRGLITKQIDGFLPYSGRARVAPWLCWGPYLWADGLTPRSDGLTWDCADFEADGLHTSAAGKTKVATLLRDFLLTHPTSVPWFT